MKTDVQEHDDYYEAELDKNERKENGEICLPEALYRQWGKNQPKQY